MNGYPSSSVIRKWAIDPDHPFHSIYKTALEMWVHDLIHECLEIADTAYDSHSAAAARVKIGVRENLMKMFAPKIFGDKQSAPTGPAVQIVIGGGNEPYEQYKRDKARQQESRTGSEAAGDQSGTFDW